MDYKTIMEETRNKSFTDLYEDLMDQFVGEYDISKDLAKDLRAKRDFGRTKYGDFSFQSSFSNALGTPINLHLKEEVIDALNYCLHERFVLGLKNPELLSGFRSIVVLLLDVYDRIETIFPETKKPEKAKAERQPV